MKIGRVSSLQVFKFTQIKGRYQILLGLRQSNFNGDLNDKRNGSMQNAN